MHIASPCDTSHAHWATLYDGCDPKTASAGEDVEKRGPRALLAGGGDGAATLGNSSADAQVGHSVSIRPSNPTPAYNTHEN